MTTQWDQWLLGLAEYVSTKSKDCTKIGAVTVGSGRNVLSIGYNGMPRGVNEGLAFRNERPTKYMYTEHAERNAIYNAARHGTRLEGATLYCSDRCICADCARAIIQAGIAKVVVPAGDSKIDTHNVDPLRADWSVSTEAARQMLLEAGVDYVEI